MTVSVALPIGIWTEISDVAVAFQNNTKHRVLLYEGPSAPSDNSVFKVAVPEVIYQFIPATSNKLYAQCVEHNGTIAYEVI